MMFLCLSGLLPKAWRIRNTHYPLSPRSQAVSTSETNGALQQEYSSPNLFRFQAIVGVNKESKASCTSLEKSTETFKSLTRWLDFSNEDAAFWWHATGRLLALLLAEASYDVHSQYQALVFYNQYVVTSLGPRAADSGTYKIWKSYMTDDHSPIEFSWNWGDSAKPPKIRCTMEAIPTDLDSIDPFNQKEAMNFVHRIRATLPKSDWQLFDHFTNAFRLRASSTSKEVVQAQSKGYKSSTFVGFEFDKSEVDVKAYFAPVVEAGDSIWKAIVRSVKALEQEHIKFPALLELEKFLADSSEGNQINVEGLAIDCIPLNRSRLKIYGRSSLTSFDSVRTYMTMGGKLSHSEGVWRQLHDLWCLLLGLDEAYPTTEDLPFKDHLTAGMMYNYDIKADNAMPEPKLYINTRHYARNDLGIAQGLTAFMEKHGRADFTSNYQRAINGFCTYRNLDLESGLQTYISCAVKNDCLSLTSYLSPQVYHRLAFDR